MSSVFDILLRGKDDDKKKLDFVEKIHSPVYNLVHLDVSPAHPETLATVSCGEMIDVYEHHSNRKPIAMTKPRVRKKRLLGVGIGVFCILLGLFLAFAIRNIYRINYYGTTPQSSVNKNDLVGTWKFQQTFTFGHPSLMILNSNGIYEIHNPPQYILGRCNHEARLYRSSTCTYVIACEWTCNDLWATMGLRGTTNIHQFIKGPVPPYQLQHYADMDPDREPPYKWNMISTAVKCPYCPAGIIDEKNRINIDSIPK